MWNRASHYTRIKLCWFETFDSAYEASAIGADALGYHIFRGDDLAEKTARFRLFFDHIPDDSQRVLLTDLDFESLTALFAEVAFDAVQFYPDWEPDEIARLREVPGAPPRFIKLMSADARENRWSDHESYMRTYQGVSDAFLLDSCREGGSGQTCDWDLAKRLVERSELPVFLAGGLDARNVGDAIGHVQPFGVDVESGVSVILDDASLPYLKDLDKCRGFVAAVERADRARLRQLAHR